MQILKKDLTRIGHIAIVVLMVFIAGWIGYKHFKDSKKLERDKKGAKIEP